MSPTHFRSHSAPFSDYAAAVARIEAMRAAEIAQPGFNPEMRSFLLSHGQKTRRAVLWFHGYTSAPRQFQELAELCFDRGYNAFVPCIPHHGFTDRYSPEMSEIKSQDLAEFSDEMVDLMHGLGEEVIVGGLSMGGAMTAWVAQQRADVAMALMVAPFLGAKIVPGYLTRAAAYAYQILPDRREWWDDQAREASPGPSFEYLKRSTRSLSQILQLGLEVFDSARQRPPAAGKIWMVINDHDDAVSNEVNQQLVAAWRKAGAANVAEFHIPDELGIPHNCIGVGIPGGRPEYVYGELMRMMG